MAEEDEAVTHGDFHSIENARGFSITRDAPFCPQISSFQEVDSEGFLTGRGFFADFNQAYVINTVAADFRKRVRENEVDEDGNLVEFHAEITGMDRSFKLPFDFNINDNFPKSGFYVEVLLATQNLLVSGAKFDLFDITGISGNFPEIIFAEDMDGAQLSGLDISSTGDNLDSGTSSTDGTGVNSGIAEFYTGYFPVCYMEGGDVRDLTLRDNIHLSDRQFMQMGKSTEPTTGAMDNTSGSTSGQMTGVQKGEALILLKKNKEDEKYPVRVRSVLAGSGIQVTELENKIRIDADHSQAEISGWSGDCIGLSGKCVYVEGTAGTVTDPAQFRRIAGSKDIGADPDGVTVTLQQPAGEEEYLLISHDHEGHGSGIWTGINCGTNNPNVTPPAQELDFDRKDVYEEGTRDPAIFRRLKGTGIVNVLYGDDAGVPAAEGDDDNCVIVIGAPETATDWTGVNCGPDNPNVSVGGIGVPAFNVYKEGTKDPAIFRRLVGDGTVTVSYSGDCAIAIKGECCSGVANIEAPHGEKIYVENTNDPAILRRLRATNHSKNMVSVHQSVDGNYINFDAGWTGENLGGYNKVFVDTTGPPSSNAKFRTIKGAGDVTVTTEGDTIKIEGRSAWTGENVGSCGTYSADIYDVESGPAAGQNAKFRKIAGGNNSGPASLPVQGQITVFQQGECIGIRGNGVNGSLTIPSNIRYDAASQTIQSSGTTTLEWQDGLIVTQGSLTQSIGY